MGRPTRSRTNKETVTKMRTHIKGQNTENFFQNLQIKKTSSEIKEVDQKITPQKLGCVIVTMTQSQAQYVYGLTFGYISWKIVSYLLIVNILAVNRVWHQNTREQFHFIAVFTLCGTTVNICLTNSDHQHSSPRQINHQLITPGSSSWHLRSDFCLCINYQLLYW